MSDQEMTENEELAEIVQDLKNEISYHSYDRGGRASDLESKGGCLQALDLSRVLATARVNPHLPIAWPSWPPGLWPKLVALMQKIVRRLLRWYIDPIVEQQNQFNAAVAQALQVLWQETSQFQAQFAQQEQGKDLEGE